MTTPQINDLGTLINLAIPHSKAPEYLIDTQTIDEEVDGAKVRCFVVPRARVFSRHEVVYLAAALSTDMETIRRRIEELKLGRRVVQKLYAVRLDAEPWSTKPLTLPILCDRERDEGCVNEVEVEPGELRGEHGLLGLPRREQGKEVPQDNHTKVPRPLRGGCGQAGWVSRHS